MDQYMPFVLNDVLCNWLPIACVTIISCFDFSSPLHKTAVRFGHLIVLKQINFLSEECCINPKLLHIFLNLVADALSPQALGHFDDHFSHRCFLVNLGLVDFSDICSFLLFLCLLFFGEAFSLLLFFPFSVFCCSSLFRSLCLL